ncbi:uncharacterized protein LOC135955406 [Calliphora vicina]|uniref:uncharacterized protein LOC135955406 n=1 Tax=Calliphora vicina TaxID=7373 RepID=UPI00325ABE8C
MSNNVDKFKLIAEVRKRPALWDIKSEEHRFKRIRQKVWKDVAVTMGSDVAGNDCNRIWRSLRDRNRVVAKKIELRIAKDKLNGTYDPNNEYKCQWVFYEHMKFANDIKKSSPTELNDNKSDDNDSNQVSESHNMDNTKMDENNSLVEREMSNAMDKLKLIAEVHKRPALWDIESEEHRSKRINKKSWKDVAVAMGSDANDCRRMWRYLRNMNRIVVKKIELRIKQAKLKGSYNPNNDYGSKWPYLAHMKFINDIKQPSPMKFGNSSVNDNKSDGNDSNQASKVHTKMEPERDLEMSKVMDKFKLIAEMRMRPALWDNKSEEHRSCLSVPEVWKDLAASMGSDVEKCQRTWVHLCKSYKGSVRRVKSRIKEDKLNGSYDPNNDYSTNWAYFEPLEFMKDYTIIHYRRPIKFRTSGKKLKLIAEVRKRPELWCVKSKEYIPRLALQKSWEDLARAMEADVTADDCKRKWTSLLLKQLTEVKKLELRIKEDKLKDSYNPNNEYRSKWFLYEHMKFCDDIKNPSLMELGNTSVNDNNSDDNDLSQVSEFENMDNYKMEPQLDLEPEVYIPDDEDYDTDSQISAMEFLSEPNSPQNYESADDKPSSTSGYCTKPSYDQAKDIKKEDSNLPKTVKLEPELDLDPEVYILDDEDDDTDSQMSGMEFLSEPNSPQNQESADDKPSSTGGNCTKRPYDQAICLEDLEKDEHNLIKPVRSNEMVPVTDSDYNFLVSFLPKMKMINELKNLQFRAKITDLMLEISRE